MNKRKLIMTDLALWIIMVEDLVVGASRMVSMLISEIYSHHFLVEDLVEVEVAVVRENKWEQISRWNSRSVSRMHFDERVER